MKRFEVQPCGGNPRDSAAAVLIVHQLQLVYPLRRADLLALADDLAAILDTDSGYVAKYARVAGVSAATNSSPALLTAHDVSARLCHCGCGGTVVIFREQAFTLTTRAAKSLIDRLAATLPTEGDQ